MENASKALIIAGAILVSILLISVGVIIINSTGKMTDQVGTSTDKMAIDTFNAQFTSYEGNAVSSSQIKALVSGINSSNGSNEATSSADEKYVELAWTSPLTGVGDLKTTKKYKVSLSYDTTTGYVNKVTISE